MKVAITGGTGFVGSAAALELRRRGHEVVLVSRRTGGDVGDTRALADAFAGCEAVLHCAGINREIGDQTYRRVHVEGTRQVVEAAKAAGVRRIALMSFLRARPGCGSGYHESKAAAEDIVRGSGLDYTVLKCGVVYGRGDHMLDHLSHTFHSFPVFGLVGLRDNRPLRPTAVADVARILAASVDDERLARRTVAVLGPETLTLGAAVRRVAEAVGRRPLFIPLPIAFHYALAWFAERLMRVPLVSLAQVRILSEGLVAPAGAACDELPADLVPELRFTPERIRAGLPTPGGFGMADLRCCWR
ncbi:MAG: NAD(P)H-binding protein [Ardenticatenia bacterium]|nr:NAD(P)H-binding protein [Ardenticatenia bacterium]